MLTSRIRLPTPRRPTLVLRAVVFLWTLPTNLLGWAICRLLSGRAGTAVGGRAARGWIYPLRFRLPWRGAITLGHHILHDPGFFDGPRGRLILAHELAHTRQHDWLGPLYLPLHGLAQLVSLVISLGSKGPHYSRVHDHNPLEQTWICIAAAATDRWPQDAAKAGLDPARLLSEFGV